MWSNEVISDTDLNDFRIYCRGSFNACRQLSRRRKAVGFTASLYLYVIVFLCSMVYLWTSESLLDLCMDGILGVQSGWKANEAPPQERIFFVCKGKGQKDFGEPPTEIPQQLTDCAQKKDRKSNLIIVLCPLLTLSCECAAIFNVGYLCFCIFSLPHLGILFSPL